MIAPLLALTLCAATPAPTPTETIAAPVAVMPFKDLSGDPELKWLSVGIAETMTVDIRRGSKLQVVERDQLDHALAELALQGIKGADESSAAKLGRMVGARTVVLGSYQESDHQLRIVARFVDVETGVVKEATKVTGPVDDVFAMQDAIVVKLVGTPFQDAVKRHKAKPKKTVEAYKLYAMSFTVMSDVERTNLLQSALKEDPDFQYAAEDLLDLQDRIKRLSSANLAAVTRSIDGFRATANDKSKSEQERMTAAMQLIGAELTGRRLHAVLRDTAWILGSELPDGPPYNIRQFALFQRINAYQSLHEMGLAMQAAENFMQTYPGSVYFTAAQGELAAWTSERARQLETQRTFEAHLQAKLAEIQRERESSARSNRPPPPHKQLSWALGPCEVMRDGEHHADAAACYRDALAHRIDAPELADRYRSVRLMVVREEESAGHFEAARRECDAFLKDDPEGALRYSINVMELALPAD